MHKCDSDGGGGGGGVVTRKVLQIKFSFQFLIEQKMQYEDLRFQMIRWYNETVKQNGSMTRLRMCPTEQHMKNSILPVCYIGMPCRIMAS